LPLARIAAIGVANRRGRQGADLHDRRLRQGRNRKARRKRRGDGGQPMGGPSAMSAGQHACDAIAGATGPCIACARRRAVLPDALAVAEDGDPRGVERRCRGRPSAPARSSSRARDASCADAVEAGGPLPLPSARRREWASEKGSSRAARGTAACGRPIRVGAQERYAPVRSVPERIEGTRPFSARGS
jgi:hypothetical protein